MARPAMAALHRRFPHAEMDLMISTEAAPLLEDEGIFRDVIPVRHSWFSRNSTWAEKFLENWDLIGYLRKRNYDLAVDFRGDFRHLLLLFLAGVPVRLAWAGTGGGFLTRFCQFEDSGKHQVEQNLALLEPLGITPEEKSLPPFSYSSQRKAAFWRRFDRVFQNLEDGMRIIIHPGAGYPSKRWPGQNFESLIEQIGREKLAHVILIGSEEEKKLTRAFDAEESGVLDLRGKTRLEELPLLFDVCDLYVGNDSGPAHIAASQGLEAIVLFSGTNEARVWQPWSRKVHLLTWPVPCSPCEAQVCPLEHHDCMRKVTVKTVYEKIRDVLSRRPAADRL